MKRATAEALLQTARLYVGPANPVSDWIADALIPVLEAECKEKRSPLTDLYTLRDMLERAASSVEDDAKLLASIAAQYRQVLNQIYRMERDSGGGSGQALPSAEGDPLADLTNPDWTGE